MRLGGELNVVVLLLPFGAVLQLYRIDAAIRMQLDPISLANQIQAAAP